MNPQIYEKTWASQLKLTTRELDVLACLTEYQSSKKIAKFLNISPRTAEAHIFNVIHKLGKNTRTSVIEMIKNSDYYQDLTLHFSHLDENFHFREHIEIIKKQVPLPRQNCYLSCTDIVLKRKIEIDLAELNIFCFNQPKKNFKTIHISFTKNYPYTFFSILAKILTEAPLVNQAINFFKKQEQQGDKNTLKSQKTRNFFTLVCMFLFFGIGLIVYHSGFFSAAQTIRSDFCVPLESQSLKRPDVLNRIKACFKKNHKIECVALVGIGGVGKTTLARQYAKQQNSALVWELNAENHSALLDAFSLLSYNLSTTREEKNEIECLRKNNNDKNYEIKLIQITKKKLVKIKNWFLIFDNAENLSSIKHFLPSDEKTCGFGQILITTRNNNIADNVYVHKSKTIFVPPLSEKQKSELFLKIQGKSFQNKNYLSSFLKTIPPFPLDIILASSYLKNTCGCSDQIQKMNNIEDKKNIRFYMVNCVVQNLIKKYPTSLPVLLFISQIGSQNIPQKLLWHFKENRPYLNKIIREMAEQSLISYGFENQELIDSFFIHRSTQANILESLLKTFDAKKLEAQTKKFLQVCADYCLLLRMCSDISALKSFSYHLKSLKTVNFFLDEWQVKSIQSLIGSIYADLACFTEALHLLEDSANYFEKHDRNGEHHETRHNLCYLAIAQKEQLDLFEAEKTMKIAMSHYQKNHIDFSDYYFTLTRLNGCYVKWYIGTKKTDIPEFKKMLIECVMIFENFSCSDLNLIFAYQELGSYYLFLEKNYEKSKFYLQKSIDLSKKSYGAQSIKSLVSEIWLSHVLRHQGKYKEAIEILQNTQKNLLNFPQEACLFRDQILILIAENYRKLGYISTAENYIKKGVFKTGNILKADPLYKYWCLNFLAKFYITVGKIPEAMNILQKSLQIHESFLGTKHFKVAWTYHLLGLCYMKNGEYSLAENFFRKSLCIYKDFFGQNHHVYGLVLKDYGFLRVLQGNFEEGIALIKTAENIFIAIKHPAQKKCQVYLKKCQWILKKRT